MGSLSMNSTDLKSNIFRKKKKMVACVLNICRFLSLFPKLYNITTIYIILNIINNIELVKVFGKIWVDTCKEYPILHQRLEHPCILVSVGCPGTKLSWILKYTGITVLYFVFA